MTTRAFDAELYLRLLGERGLTVSAASADPNAGPSARLREAAAALAVAGLIDPALARRTTRDYGAARQMCQGDHPGKLTADDDRAVSEPPRLLPRQVFELGANVPVGHGELRIRALTWTRKSVQVLGAFQWEPGDDQPSGPHLPTLSIVDATGVSVNARFRGSRGPHHVEGTWESDGALGPDLACVDVAGTRIALTNPITPPHVEIEPLAPEGVHRRYLWQLLAHRRHAGTGERVRAAADALIAAGLVDREDAELEAMLWIADAESGSGGGNLPAAVPPPWLSLLAPRGGSSGPSGTLVVGAVTPVFGDISIAVNTFTSEPERFWLSVDTAGVTHPFGMGPDVAWWASDDRENHYLGHAGIWTANASEAWGTGEIHFGALDPTATELTLAPTTVSARARIRIPLGWDV